MCIEIKDDDIVQFHRILLEAQNYVYGRKLECFGNGDAAWEKWEEEYDHIRKIAVYIKEQIRKQDENRLII